MQLILFYTKIFFLLTNRILIDNKINLFLDFKKNFRIAGNEKVVNFFTIHLFTRLSCQRTMWFFTIDSSFSFSWQMPLRWYMYVYTHACAICFDLILILYSGVRMLSLFNLYEFYNCVTCSTVMPAVCCILQISPLHAQISIQIMFEQE